MTIREGGKSVEKTGGSPDYSIAIGSVGMTSGVHTWELRIDKDTDGVWIGVTTEEVTCGSRITAQSAPKSWIWRPSGEFYQHDRGNQKQSQNMTGFRSGEVIRLTVDFKEGSIKFENTARPSSSDMVLSGIDCEVFPFICFDYTTVATIVSQSGGGSTDWLGAAQTLWNRGDVEMDTIGRVDASWSFACDESLCQALGRAELGTQLTEILADLRRYPLIKSVRVGVLLRRARMLIRYSSLVVSVMPLLSLRGSGTPCTREIRSLRSLVLPEHKAKFIESVLGGVRGNSGGDRDKPVFKVSRAKVLSGRPCASDGSDSIAFQIFNELKKKSGAHKRDELYRGRALWWQVEFLGEGGQDVGGLFRESVVDISSDLMSTRTPLFIHVPNADADAGTIQDSWTPNPDCTNFEVYEWVGRLCAAAILSEECLVLRFPPMVWKLIGGAEASMEDLQELDAFFLKNTLKIVDEMNGAPMTEDVFEYIPLTWSITLSNGAEVNLVPGGNDIDVEFSRRKEFQQMACKARLQESSDQIAAIRRGLTAIIPAPLIRLWTAQELERRVCGSPDIPIDELRKTARYDIPADSPEVQFMFAALEEMSNEDRSLFLRFVTGRARLPASIKISRLHGSPESFPCSHTCFNQIDIPRYTSKEQCLEKLMYAIQNTRTMDTDHAPGEAFVLE
jgi:E3 ubiquitin-protein ligase HECTD3